MKLYHQNLHLKISKPVTGIIIFVMVLSNIKLIAQDITADLPENNPKVKVFSLNDCLTIAFDNNHKIKASEYGVRISENKKKQAESAYWPQVSAKALYSYSDQDPIFVMPSFQMTLPPVAIMGLNIPLQPIDIPAQEVKLMDRQNLHAVVGFSLPVYSGGKIQAINKQAEKGIELSRQDLRKTNLEIRYDIIRYYYSAMLSRKVYSIGSDALERLEATLKITESTYQNGSGKVTKLDFLKNKVMVDQVRTIVTDMKKNVKLSMDALAFTMGIGDEFTLPNEEIPFDQQKVELAMSGNINYINNPDWVKLNAASDLYQAKVEEAFSGYLPKILLSGSFAQNINSYRSGIANKYNSQMWTINIGAEIPIFDGFRTSDEVDEAKVMLRKTEEDRSLLKDAITLQIKEALKRIEVSAENVNNTRQAALSANESRSLYERAFKQDMAEAKDLVESQIMESIMEVQHQKALYDHIEALAYLDLITGKAGIPLTKSMVSN